VWPTWLPVVLVSLAGLTTFGFAMAHTGTWLTALIKARYQLMKDGPDGACIFAKNADKGGGFDINTGCNKLIEWADGSVKYGAIEKLKDYSVIVRGTSSGEE
jgi:hypothetical protein